MIAALLLALALWLGWRARQRPGILPWPTVGCFLGFLAVLYEPLGSLGDTQVHVLDLLVVACLPTCLGATVARRWGAVGAWAGVLVLLGVIAFLRGLPEFGLAVAGNALRQLAWFAVPMMALGVAPPTTPAAWLRPVAALALGILLLAGLRYAGVMPMSDDLLAGGGLAPSGWLRPVPASAALVLLLVGAVLLTQPAPRPRRLVVLACLCLAAAVLLQHRSVWVAGIALGAVLAWRILARSGLRRATVIWVCVLTLGCSALVGWPNRVSDALEGSASEVSGSSGTGGWRVQSNVALLRLLAEQPATNLVLGLPAGHRLDRDIGDIVATASAHNAFLQMLANAGLLGIAALAGLLWTVWRRSLRGASPLGEAAPAAVAAITAFYLAYGPSAAEALLLAGAAAALPPHDEPPP